MIDSLAYTSTVVLVVGLVLWWKTSRNKGKERYLIAGIPKGTVVLHQFGPAPYAPSISPFVIKLETYLKAAKIPYVNRYDRKLGPKGKLPWIQYNDDVIPDSQIIIEFLNKEFKVDLNKKLTNDQKAMGHVLRKMVEEWLYWIIVIFRLTFEPNGTIYRKLGVPSIIIWYMRRNAKSGLWAQGIGRHSREEVTSMMKNDLTAIDTILGDKNYLFGETPDDVTEFDCALFGQLCQLAWQVPGCGMEELVQDKYPRLISYCERMKETFWPDWDKLLMKDNHTETSKKSPVSSPPPSSSLLSSSSSSEAQNTLSNGSNGHSSHQPSANGTTRHTTRHRCENGKD